jgi:hypothetical protein
LHDATTACVIFLKQTYKIKRPDRIEPFGLQQLNPLPYFPGPLLEPCVVEAQGWLLPGFVGVVPDPLPEFDEPDDPFGVSEPGVPGMVPHGPPGVFPGVFFAGGFTVFGEP